MENPIQQNAGGRITSQEGELWWTTESGVKPIGSLVRCFPATAADTWLSIRDTDGQELALIRNPETLDPDSRNTIAPVLHDKYHVPVITRIVSVTSSVEGKHLEVEAEEGPLTFDITGESDVDYREYPSVQLTDRSKRRKYLIPDAATLDQASRNLLRQHLRSRGRRGRSFR